MRDVLDILGVAVSGLTAKLTRTFLIMLGPVIGVSAIVAAVGLTESAKGDLQQTLAALGTNLITVEATGSFGSQNPTFPEDVVDRVMAVTTVESASAALNLSGITTTPYDAAKGYYEAFPIPVMAVDTAFPAVMGAKLSSGRWLNEFDNRSGGRSVVIGTGLANEIDYLPGSLRTINVGGVDYGIVGVIERVILDPNLDNGLFISFESADQDFDTGTEATKLYVRAIEGTTEETEAAMSTAINLGDSTEVTTSVPTDALESAAAADSTLQIIVASMGLLALVVGGVGIANVMSISVIQRSSEIGIRRALGHGRSLIAWQFLLESVAVGLFGGLLGAGVGIGIVVVASRVAGWVHVLTPELDLFGLHLPAFWFGIPTLCAIGVAAAVFTAVIAGLYPSIKAARLEPLETLRLG